MNQAVAAVAKVVGQVTVVLALIVLFWTLTDLASSNEQNNIPAQFRQNQYLDAFANSASLAVSGMLSLALGTLLEYRAERGDDA